MEPQLTVLIIEVSLFQSVHNSRFDCTYISCYRGIKVLYFKARLQNLDIIDKTIIIEFQSQYSTVCTGIQYISNIFRSSLLFYVKYKYNNNN